ncbi:hypothetical protein GN958_ATG08952 [Phytophthora infestans]|uniref:Uncharacterized protein n=1 Tax=Phytophthora infestans TaxID=4787 RepID=A0A8S9UQL7_PHYIN|nr:hypothetical protein GN958_ATG08952 [Phytophthora infestans]
MAHNTHSALFWLQRCINDSSSGDENVSPNVCPDPRRSGTAKGIDAAIITPVTPFSSYHCEPDDIFAGAAQHATTTYTTVEDTIALQ